MSQLLFGYLKLSPEGLEYQRFPFQKIQCTWDAVEKVQQGTLNLPRQGLLLLMPKNLAYASLLIRRSKPGWEFPIGRTKFGSAQYHIVPLSELEGWADGSLAMQLRLYAPKAFEPTDSAHP